jgi:hypothetical protein
MDASVSNCREKYSYAIGARVIIVETQHPGVVTALLTDSCGAQYRVVWWNNGERKQEWLYEFEIAARPPQ